MKTHNLMPGVKLAESKPYSVLFGIPPEIIKIIAQKKLPFPEILVLPDSSWKYGTLQNCTEFPLYYFLFVMGQFSKKNKLKVVGSPTAIRENKELLRLTLLGPTLKEYEHIGTSKYFNSLYHESRALALKSSKGVEYSIEDLVEFIPFKKGVAEYKNIKIKHDGNNVYELNNNKIDINFSEAQHPPYDLKIDYIPLTPLKFGVDILGGASGFSVDQPCSGLLLNYNSDYMLIDCVPYLQHSLNARGVSKQQVRSIFLSHVHDDHCNILPLIEFNDKIKFLGTKEIFWMATKKLSLQTHLPQEQFTSYFDFQELQPYEENEFYGMKIIPHYTVHSIPTIGATFLMDSGNDVNSIVFVGDNKSLPDITKMKDTNIVSNKKHNYIHSLYHNRYNLLFADGGMGILHGDPKDSLKSRSERIIFLHLENLPTEFDATFSIAKEGKRYVIQPSDENSYLIKTMETFYKKFSGITVEWMTTLMNNLKISHYNSGDVIMKQGEKSRGVIYLILSGSCIVKKHDGKKLFNVALKETGDFIGEMAIVKQVAQRSASIVANIPVTLGEISEDLFYNFLKSEKRIATMKRMWQIRARLEKTPFLSAFSNNINERIAMIAKFKKVQSSEIIATDKELVKTSIILLKGEISLEIRKSKSKLKPGKIIHLPYKDVKKQKLIASTQVEYLSFNKVAFQKILNQTPRLLFYCMNNKIV